MIGPLTYVSENSWGGVLCMAIFWFNEDQEWGCKNQSGKCVSSLTGGSVFENQADRSRYEEWQGHRRVTAKINEVWIETTWRNSKLETLWNLITSKACWIWYHWWLKDVLTRDKQRAGICTTVQSCMQIPITKKKLWLLVKERDDRASCMADRNMVN